MEAMNFTSSMESLLSLSQLLEKIFPSRAKQKIRKPINLMLSLIKIFQV
jgi:hypothetical protein